tara:strand:- start:6198 stop:6650 length:453 start_codon:yes stop_codon:yes gene_type:complete
MKLEQLDNGDIKITNIKFTVEISVDNNFYFNHIDRDNIVTYRTIELYTDLTFRLNDSTELNPIGTFTSSSNLSNLTNTYYNLRESLHKAVDDMCVIYNLKWKCWENYDTSYTIEGKDFVIPDFILMYGEDEDYNEWIIKERNIVIEKILT